MLCEHIIESRCAKGHVQRRKCHMNQPAVCRTCERQDEKRQKELQEELGRQARREQQQKEHEAKMAELDRQIRLVREQAADGRAAEENTRALEQKKQDLEAARRLAEQVAANAAVSPRPETPTATPKPPKSSSEEPPIPSLDREQEVSPIGNQHKDKGEQIQLACEQEWDRQKRVDGASNDAIDALMALTGLEDAKSKILDIKAKIETVLRQGTDMKDERLGIVLLGNPGTGMICACWPVS